MHTASYLKKGDHIAIVCTASHVGNGIDAAVKIFENWGLVVHLGKSVSARKHSFAGTDEIRRADLQDALDNPNIKAILIGRGGYGTVRIIDDIDFSAFLQDPKWLVGFSDITVLHSHIQRHLGLPTIHGHMPKTMEKGTKTSIESLRKALFGADLNLSYRYREGYNRIGAAQGVLVGGNLAILHSLIATPSDIDYREKILFIEDVGERHYNIDRMLWTLKRAGKLEKLNGLIIGGFTALKDTERFFGQSLKDIIYNKIAEYEFPVSFGCPAGHIENNHALMLGKKVQVTVENNRTSLTYID